MGNREDGLLTRMLGLEGVRTAVYKFAEGEVSKEDFEYAQVLDQVLFDEKIGYIATLGPTWNMVHDPRFLQIENSFVIERRGMVGGNANVGIGVMSEDGLSGGNPNDLERYSEILGEGRNLLKAVRAAALDPATFSDNDGFIWAIIRQQSPNWFRQNGSPNKEATRQFDMCKAGLVGLIADYAEEPLADEWVDAESGEVLTGMAANDPDVMGVYLEVDQLDKAINTRTQLRLLAIRILNQLGLAGKIKTEEGRLTDIERDELLSIIYKSDFPDNKPQLMANILMFISTATKRPFEEREREQLARASEQSKETVAKIKSGEIAKINRVTDPGEDWQPEESTRLLDEIYKDPLKRHLFPIYTKAEKVGNAKIVELLAPVFATPDFVLDDTNYWDILKKIEEASKPAVSTTVEAEFNGLTPAPIDKVEGTSLSLSHADGCPCSTCNPKFGPA